MLRKLALVGAVALLAAAGASAAGGVATASLSSSSPGARDVSVAIELQDVTLRCGQLEAQSLTIALPRAMGVPASIPKTDVRVGGHQVSSARAESKSIVLGLPSSGHRMTCDLMSVGPLRITVAGAAALRNPTRAGKYAFSVSAKPHGAVWRGSLVVR